MDVLKKATGKLRFHRLISNNPQNQMSSPPVLQQQVIHYHQMGSTVMPIKVVWEAIELVEEFYEAETPSSSLGNENPPCEQE